MKTTITAMLAATFLSSCALARTPAPTAAPVAVKVVADPALWVVKDEDTTIYLFGTIHLLKPEIVWFDGGVKKAYDASSEIVLEMVEPDPAKMQALIGQIGVDRDGPPLTAKLGAEAAARYASAMTDLGLPVPSFEVLEPWLVATIMSVTAIQKVGLSGESGVEKQIAAAVKRDGKAVLGLETAEQQLGFFDSLPEPLQIAFLNESVKQLADIKPMFDKMVADWAKGDPEALGRLLNEAMVATPEIAKVLLADRNARWADWIDTRLDTPGVVFVAVGAGHLAGKDSVQAMLDARKIKVMRIPG